MIMNMLEQQKPEIANNGIWKSLKGKSPQEIEGYAGNLVNTLGIFKQ